MAKENLHRNTGGTAENNTSATVTASVDAESARLDRLAWLLDNSIRLPGGYRIGLDGLIGLIPGLGDAASALISGYIVLESYRLGAPRTLLVRMLGNVGVELLVGSVPLIGDIFDMAFKANVRNVALLQEYQTASLPATASTMHEPVEARPAAANNTAHRNSVHSPAAEPAPTDREQVNTLARRSPLPRRLLLGFSIAIAVAIAGVCAYSFFNFSIAIIADVFASTP